MESTKTRAEVINSFLEKEKFKANDLARYLDLNHGFCCYSDTQYDD